MKRARFSLLFLCTISLFFICKTSIVSAAPSVTVYATGVYTYTTVDISLYADIKECNLVSSGAKVLYNPVDLTLVSAEKNDTDWYLGEVDNKLPYMVPDTSTTGEIVFIGGKLDINDPTAGVTGDKILLGHISFQRNNSNIPAFSLTYGRDGAYKNFVTTGNLILDDQVDGVVFVPVVLDFDSVGLPWLILLLGD